MAAAAFSAPSASRSATTTRAPSAANLSAEARPMPDAAPVITATFPSSLPSRTPTLAPFPGPHRKRLGGGWPPSPERLSVAAGPLRPCLRHLFSTPCSEAAILLERPRVFGVPVQEDRRRHHGSLSSLLDAPPWRRRMPRAAARRITRLPRCP